MSHPHPAFLGRPDIARPGGSRAAGAAAHQARPVVGRPVSEAASVVADMRGLVWALAGPLGHGGDESAGSLGARRESVWQAALDAFATTPTGGAQGWLIALPPALSDDERDPGRARFAVSAIDDRGRLADRSLVRGLGWRTEHRFTVRRWPATVLLSTSPQGIAVVTRHGFLRLPPVARRALRLHGGERLLLVAALDGRHLAVFTATAVEHMAAAYAITLTRKEPP